MDYAKQRRQDPRIAARIEAALANAETVLNVGAGAGSYEPGRRKVVAIEPSAAMIAQRPAGSAPVVVASAEELPFDDGSFDAAIAVLTVHHWRDQTRGLREMRRVARGPVVILTFDPAQPGCWLNDYFPALRALDEAQMPPMELYGEVLGRVEVAPVAVPWDCHDGFLYAYWRRPEAYLDPHIRTGISSFWKMDDVELGVARLGADLASGEWRRRQAGLLGLDELDVGYRLVRSGADRETRPPANPPQLPGAQRGTDGAQR